MNTYGFADCVTYVRPCFTLIEAAACVFCTEKFSTPYPRSFAAPNDDAQERMTLWVLFALQGLADDTDDSTSKNARTETDG